MSSNFFIRLTIPPKARCSTTTAVFFYGTRLREQCEHDHAFGYEMMKRMSQVVIQRLQATRKQLVSIRH